MANLEPPYQCLAKNRFGLAGLGSLWLGPDHLVMVQNTFAVETYRRWYFKDIQALIARRSVTRIVWNIVMGAGFLIIGLGAVGCFAASGSSAGADREALIAFGVVFGVLAVGCLVILIINSLLGPGCVVHVQTSFGVDKLSIPNRLPAFNRMAARIQPLIEACQAQEEAGSVLEPPVIP